MSASNQTADSPIANLTTIFEAASNEYRSLTGQNIGTHPLATELERNSSPESILGLLRKQLQALDKSRKGDDKLMKSLTSIVYVISTLSTTLGAGICIIVSPHCFCTPVLQYLSPAILSCDCAFYWYRCSFWGKFLLVSFVRHS